MIKKVTIGLLFLSSFSFLYSYNNFLTALANKNKLWIKTTAMNQSFINGNGDLFEIGDHKDNAITSLSIQKDGKIVVAGVSKDLEGFDKFALARYTTAGNLDPSFGSGGQVSTKIGDGGVDVIYTLTIDIADNIVVGGCSKDSTHGYHFAVARYTSKGDLDTTFGNQGVVATVIGDKQQDVIHSLIIQQDRKIVVGGSSLSVANGHQFALARYTNAGALDATFGSGGKVVTPIGDSHEDVIYTVTVDHLNRIVAGGLSKSAANGDQFALVRYTHLGALDTDFGSGGKVLTTMGDLHEAAIHALAIQNNTKIVAGGFSKSVAKGVQFALARYSSGGVLDTGFGTAGKVFTSAGDGNYSVINALALDSDNKIVVGGVGKMLNGDYRFALARYGTTGSLDTAFGTDGTMLTDVRTGVSSRAFSRAPSRAINSYEDKSNALIMLEGKTIVAGSVKDATNGTRFALARYDSTGVLDTTFDEDGKVITAIGVGGEDVIYTVTVQTTGKIVVGGYSKDSAGKYQFALARYGATGALDSTFGTGGKVVTTIGNGGDDRITALTIDGSGNIIVGGFTKDTTAGYRFVVARYTTGGVLDSGFGTGGRVITAIGNAKNDRIAALALDGGGKIVVGGYSQDINDGYRFALARYTDAGVLDDSFDNDGKVVSVIGNAKDDRITALKIDGSGNIVVGGFTKDTTAGYRFVAARYTTAGGFDSTFGSGGKAIIAVGDSKDDRINALTLQSDGKVVVGGFSKSATSGYQFTLVRFDGLGGVDTTFNFTGKSALTIGDGKDDAVTGLAMVSNKVVAGGFSKDSANNYQFALARYITAGPLDTTFSTDGKVITTITDTTEEVEDTVDLPNTMSDDEDVIKALVVRGRNIIVGGYSRRGPYDCLFALAKYNSKGKVATHPRS